MSDNPYILAFANQKGGVGKSTSAVNISSLIAEMGYKVLVIDCDPQGNTTSGMGINKKKLSHTVYDCLVGDCSPRQAVIRSEWKNLSVIPATLDLHGAEFDLIGADKWETRIKSVIDEVGPEYDFVILDSPPSLGVLTVNVLTAADGVVIPMTPGFYDLEGLSQLMISIKKVKERYNPDLRITGILVTMFDGRLNLSAQVLAEIKRYYSDKLFPTVIPRNVTLSEAPGFGKPINYHDRYSKGCVAYTAVAEEIIKRTIG